jgi:hypothetical protein
LSRFCSSCWTFAKKPTVDGHEANLNRRWMYVGLRTRHRLLKENISRKNPYG